MSPRFVLGRENVPWVAEVVNRSLKADCTDFTPKAKATITQYDLSSRFFCIDATLLCEFESDKI